VPDFLNRAGSGSACGAVERSDGFRNFPDRIALARERIGGSTVPEHAVVNQVYSTSAPVGRPYA
jgi:hypothetical protein